MGCAVSWTFGSVVEAGSYGNRCFGIRFPGRFGFSSSAFDFRVDIAFHLRCSCYQKSVEATVNAEIEKSANLRCRSPCALLLWRGRECCFIRWSTFSASNSHRGKLPDVEFLFFGVRRGGRALQRATVFALFSFVRIHRELSSFSGRVKIVTLRGRARRT